MGERKIEGGGKRNREEWERGRKEGGEDRRKNWRREREQIRIGRGEEETSRNVVGGRWNEGMEEEEGTGRTREDKWEGEMGERVNDREKLERVSDREK